jgi:hypothetical protein
MVKSVQRSVAASTSCFRGQRGHQTAEERAGSWDKEEEPGAKFRRVRRGAEHFAVRLERLVTRQILEKETLHDLEPGEKERPDEAGDGTDEGGVKEHSPEGTKFELGHRGGTESKET